MSSHRGFAASHAIPVLLGFLLALAAPLVAGLAATAVALPVAALPIVTIGTAVAFGVGVASGVVSGRREPGA